VREGPARARRQPSRLTALWAKLRNHECKSRQGGILADCLADTRWSGRDQDDADPTECSSRTCGIRPHFEMRADVQCRVLRNS
jgi:hypothetical protein